MDNKRKRDFFINEEDDKDIILKQVLDIISKFETRVNTPTPKKEKNPVFSFYES